MPRSRPAAFALFVSDRITTLALAVALLGLVKIATGVAAQPASAGQERVVVHLR
jgi:hypothetical protein